MIKSAIAMFLCIPVLAGGATVLDLNIYSMQTDTSDATLDAFSGAKGKVIPLNRNVPVLKADESYSGPNVYGGVSRNIFKGTGGVSDQFGTGWRLRVNNTVPFVGSDANSGALELSVLYVFKPIIDGMPGTTQFTDGNDQMFASDISTSDMSRAVSATISFVIRDAGAWYISESSPNLQTGDLAGHTLSMHFANALSVTWYEYDPVTNVASSVSRGDVATPGLASIDFVGFLLETKTVEEQGGYNFGVRVFTVEGIKGIPKWGGFDIIEGRYVDTGNIIGLLEISANPWMYSYSQERYIYIPDWWVTPAGTYFFVPHY